MCDSGFIRLSVYMAYFCCHAQQDFSISSIILAGGVATAVKELWTSQKQTQMCAILFPSSSDFMTKNEQILWKKVKYIVALAHKSLFFPSYFAISAFLPAQKNWILLLITWKLLIYCSYSPNHFLLLSLHFCKS